MRRRFNGAPLLALLPLVLLLVVPAQATVQLRITDGNGVSSGIQTGSPCGPNCSSDTYNFTDLAYGLTLVIQTGTSNSPGGPATLTFNTDATIGTPTLPLAFPITFKVEITDTGFLAPTGMVIMDQHLNTNSPSLTAALGSVNGIGYYGTGGAGNVAFCEAGGTCNEQTPTISFSSFSLTNPGQDATTSFTAVSPYSLDEVLNFTITGLQAGQTTGRALVQGTLDLTPNQIPEPGSVALLGGVLMLTFGAIRRKVHRT